jgi:hypothetical protein
MPGSRTIAKARNVQKMRVGNSDAEAPSTTEFSFSKPQPWHNKFWKLIQTHVQISSCTAAVKKMKLS